MNGDQLVGWLVLFLEESLRAAWSASDPGPAFRSDSGVFRSLGTDAEPAVQSFPAFFDRLLDDAHRLVGLQVTPVVWWDLPLIVGRLPYTQAVDNEQRLRVFFGGRVPNYVVDMNDQAFGGGVYASDDGRYAITVDTYFLTGQEIDSLRSASLRWTSVTSEGSP